MAQDPLIGSQLANFRVDRVLGRGGMATVYYGQDVKLNRPVAIKVIEARFREKTTYIERFVQEARALAGWRHENIVQIYYADNENGLYYFVMEYIDGQNLAEILKEYAANGELIPVDDVLRIGDSIASALDYAHQHNMIHRDVKPSNIFVERDGRVVLGDFGLALDTQQGSVGETFGTARYIAPEQANRSNAAVPESDLYSMGIILYEMLVGMVPFDDPSPTSVALQQLTLAPPSPRQMNPDINTETEAVLLKALSKTPADRYHTGAELMEALKTALQAGASSLAVGLDLLPLPGVSMPPVPKPRSISQVSVVDRVRLALDSPLPAPPLQLPVEPTQRVAYPTGGPLPPASKDQLVPSPEATTPEAQPKALPNRRLWVISSLAGCLVILAAGFIIILMIAGKWLGKSSATVRAVTLSPNAIPALPNTTSTIAGESSPTSIALETSTVKYPSGRRFMLYYNQNSFYILQLIGDNMPISPVAFERLDKMGIPTNQFSGQRWAEFYPTIKVGICMRIEILGSASYLRPPECNNEYYATRTPSHDDPGIFWTPLEGSSQFRVLWKSEEVARCEIAAQVCEVFFP